MPVVASASIVGWHDEAKVAGPGVVIGRSGSIGGGQWIKGDYWPLNTTLWVKDFKENDRRFIYYLLRSIDFSPFNAGSGVPTLNRNHLNSVQVLMPSVAEQRAIAGVLGALDDKIESNRRLASTCDELAAGILAAGLNEGVTTCTVGDVASFKNKNRKPLSSLQRAEMTGDRVYPYYGATGVFDYVDDFLFDELTVLVGEDGSVVNDDGSPVVQMAWGKYWVNNHAHVLVGSSIQSEVLYVALRRSDIRPLVTGAVQAKVSMGNLRSLVLELPPESLWEALGQEIRDIVSRMRSSHDESSSLKALRDALLPELLSGRLRVCDAERVVEEVV